MNIFFIFFTIFFVYGVFAVDGAEDFFKGKTKLDHPFELRDPFKRPLRKEEKKTVDQISFLQNGIYTNLPTFEGVPLKNIRITGILVGPERRAMAQITLDNGVGQTVILKEGMILGEDKAEIKAILPGGVVLVEKTINIYGKEEYLETVLPLNSKN